MTLHQHPPCVDVEQLFKGLVEFGVAMGLDPIAIFDRWCCFTRAPRGWQVAVGQRVLDHWIMNWNKYPWGAPARQTYV